MKSSITTRPSALISAATQDLAAPADALLRAQKFASPLLAHECVAFGENALHHAQGVAEILQSLGATESLQAASYLVLACEQLAKPLEALTHAFDENYARLAVEATQMMQAQRLAAQAALPQKQASGAPSQAESVRKMLLAFSRDLRVVLLGLASCLQSLRWCAQAKQTPDAAFASQAQQIFAPLANRLGIWQIKWELEDLAFRFLEPEVYKDIAKSLAATRIQREAIMAQLQEHITQALAQAGIRADVQGRPKHIYSIVKKMRGKKLRFDEVLDVRALRILVADVDACYATLALIHSLYTPLADEFSDYIAKPKINGYQSLHTVVCNAIPAHPELPVEIQIRTQAMHDAAETGVAAHWAYKEAGAKGYAGVSASSEYDAKIAMLRQLLAWERDISEPAGSDLLADRIYVFTPDARVVDLPAGASPVDFAYAVHTNLGHRCRGARVDGQLVPLNTPLKNGQTVEITAAKEGAPSRNWLIEEGYLASSRARAKVRAWFNAQALDETRARGREQLEKLLQREGKTALKLEDLAQSLGLKSAEQLFEAIGKDELSLRTIEQSLRPQSEAPSQENAEALRLKKSLRPSEAGKGGVLVVGVDSLLTQLAKCCRPAPPDAISGYVTRGRGVSIHRCNCPSFAALLARDASRVIEVAWGKNSQAGKNAYSVALQMIARERPHLLRDVMDSLAKGKISVSSVKSQNSRGLLQIHLILDLHHTEQLPTICNQLQQIEGVQSCSRA